MSSPSITQETPAEVEAPKAASTSEDKRPLTTADRCDACGAQAYVRVVLPIGELMFCGHHGRMHTPVLEAQALFIQDETGRLTTGG